MKPPLIKFIDPIFDYLHTNKLSKMWEILILRSIPDLKIKLSDVKPNEYNDTALGVASYNFSKNKRPVANHNIAQSYYQDGLIISHPYNFDI
jgi:hypothetical protein